LVEVEVGAVDPEDHLFIRIRVQGVGRKDIGEINAYMRGIVFLNRHNLGTDPHKQDVNLSGLYGCGIPHTRGSRTQRS